MNLNELLDAAVARWPEQAAVVEGGRIVSYSDLAEIIADFSRRLETMWLPPGCRVGLRAPNSVHYIALTYALWRVGAVVVPIPVECQPDEITGIIGRMQLQVVIDSQPSAGGELFAAGFYFRRLSPATAPDNHGLNIAFIRFTSGTTGTCKGVVLCHETIRDRVVSANKTLGVGPQDVVMWRLPMAHHFLISIVLYLSHGSAIVIARHATPRSFLAELIRWHGTVLYDTPRFLGLLAREDSGASVPSLRLAVSTASPLSEDVAARFAQRFHVPLTQALGVIELGLVAANLQDPFQRWNSVGRVAGDFRVTIVGPDTQGWGELAVAGPGMLDAYAAPWCPREQILRDGWFYTGDIARMDTDGLIVLLSRKAAVINRAGQKIFPEEVEAVLNRHPAVRESRVFGRRHPRLGETVEAELVLKRDDANLDQILGFCRTQLAAHKVPSRLHVVPELARTPVTGKIRRATAIF